MAPTKTTHSNATLSLQAEQQLSRRWMQKADTRALSELIHAHVGLVIKIATEFRNSGPSMEDLIQEGHVGLTIAARRFDPTKATRLATYATYWIRACMMEFVVRSHGPVRIGTTRSQRKIFFGLGRARRRLERGRAGGVGLRAGETCSACRPRTSSRWRRDCRATTYRSTRRAARTTSGGRANAARQRRAVPRKISTPTARRRARARALLHQALTKLDTRERAILKARHMSARPTTLGALGKRFGISRERVRQLELRAVAKLRSLLSRGRHRRACCARGPEGGRPRGRLTEVLVTAFEEPEIDGDAAAPTPERRRAGEALSVLIVDDDASNLDYLSALVESLGYSPETAASGRDGARGGWRSRRVPIWWSSTWSCPSSTASRRCGAIARAAARRRW